MQAPDSYPAEFYAHVRFLESLGYRERRRALWHRHRPQRLPRYLYKFRPFDASDSVSIERVRDILLQSRLRLASPQEFNDPFDMAVNVVIEGPQAEIRQRLDAVYKERGVKWADRQREISRATRNSDDTVARAQKSFRAAITEAGVCSFGGNPRSILMWSHYADDHRGLCLQFEVARDLAIFAQALPVNYAKEYPVLNWVNEKESITAVLLRKFVGWEYEQERRIVIPEEARRFIHFRPAALSGVIIGSSASDENVDRLKQIIAERTSMGLPTPRLYRAFTAETQFRLIIKAYPGDTCGSPRSTAHPRRFD